MKKCILLALCLGAAVFSVGALTLVAEGFLEAPASAVAEGTVHVKSPYGGSEFLEIRIGGGFLRSLSVGSLKYDDDGMMPLLTDGVYSLQDVYWTANDLKEAVLVVSCTLPEGMPYEGVLWTETDGTVHSWAFQDYWFSGMGGSGPVGLR